MPQINLSPGNSREEPCENDVDHAKKYADRYRNDQNQYRQPGRLLARRPGDSP